MNKKILFRKVYRLLENSTPLKFDCGELCDKSCCSGDENTGMHLYPGEETLLKDKTDFLSIREEVFNDKEIFFAVCSGKCDRQFRPLACRIYPLVPYFDQNGKLNIIHDPRAKYICPLLLNSDDIAIDRKFIRNVRKAFQLLSFDTEIRSYINTLSVVLDEYSKFTELNTP